MCRDGYDRGDTCPRCGGKVLICWDDGPMVNWHADDEQGRACVAAFAAGVNGPAPGPATR